MRSNEGHKSLLRIMN